MTAVDVAEVTTDPIPAMLAQLELTLDRILAALDPGGSEATP